MTERKPNQSNQILIIFIVIILYRVFEFIVNINIFLSILENIILILFPIRFKF